jgi:hypothetical protein
MSQSQDLRTGTPRSEPPRPGDARDQLEHLYRAIGIQAVAAAAAQVSRPAKLPEPVHHILPACLRDDDALAA